MDLQEIIDIWTSGRTPATRKHYQPLATRWEEVSQRLYGQPLIQATSTQLLGVLRVSGAAHNDRTRAACIWAMKGLFRVVVEELGLRKDNPASLLRAPKFEEDLANRCLTHEQVVSMLGVCKTAKERLLLQVLYGSGLRISEALSLRRPSLIHRTGYVLKIYGKGGKNAHIRISDELGKLLDEALPKNPDHYLFSAHSDEAKPMTRHVAWQIVKRVATRAGLPQVSPHFLRHTHATVALENGANIVLVKESLRHSNIQTTMKYSHIRPDQGAALYLPKL